jgi:putative aminopeptidase FrvX
MDSYTISNRKLLKFVIKVAEECGIPYQVSIMKRGGTDASKYQTTNFGMSVLLVNVPSRYAHTPTSMIQYDDYIHSVKLMTEVIKRLDREAVDEIRSF